YAAIHDFVGAAIAYETAWRLAQVDTVTGVKAGNARLSFGDINGAAAVARELLLVSDSYVDAHLLLARALLEAGALRSAEKELRTAIGLAPENAVAYELLAQVQRRAGNPKAAEELLAKATRFEPRAPRPRVALASLYLETGRLDDGERQLR